MNNCIGITIGDPNGLGPELIVRFFNNYKIESPVIIIGPESVLRFYADLFKINKFWQKTDSLDSLNKGIYVFYDKEEHFYPTPSHPTVEGGKIAIRSIDLACSLIKEKKIYGLITAPVNKSLIQEAGRKDFFGHTEYLAKRFGLSEEEICMHLFSSKLKVSLVTTHIPIKDVSKTLSVEKIIKKLSLTWEYLKKIEKDPKPIGVCGLNPHAGEDGKIGEEEIKVILPAIKESNKIGIKAKGPFPADTIFNRALKGEFSSILAMYHDQGLAPLKTFFFEECVNITLGLPFIRTSVGHGTGYDIAGKGKASLLSFKGAFETAKMLIPRFVLG